MVIKRSALRAQVREEILHRMRTGSVKPGEQINEVQLAAELGVSRTPLREALIALEGEGQIASESGRGFRFLPLSATELVELAPVLSTLEGLALDLSDIDDLRRIGAELQTMSDDFAEETVQHAILNQRDDSWHRHMLSVCPNQRLLVVIENVRATMHRYEALLVNDEQLIARRTEEHAAIATCLAEGDVEGAKQALANNWAGGTQRLLEVAEPAAD
ncbi:GntR family transcriptional regulator [Ruania alkalisoli]|uniref:GntR family transcriptional regulator n=1 Tax=Ruania alkalisoli TaxID=2779775 RepID=A0A7M1SU04_9MICO|nr:GntR family transcriptional regulator [Ruania alkalisoli]QOR71056.1 GntR family transcriptional regulator [Ruania alkalisoli]